MGIASKFENFIYALRIPDDKIAKIADRYKQITKRLNNDFWNKNSEKEHSLYVGSYGRDTETKTSDIDMLFWLPYEKYSQYNNYSGNGQSALLTGFVLKLCLVLKIMMVVLNILILMMVVAGGLQTQDLKYKQ